MTALVVVPDLDTDPMPEPDPPIFVEAMAAMPWDTQFEVAFVLDGPRGPYIAPRRNKLQNPVLQWLPNLSTIELEAGTEVMEAIATLPQYVDGVRPEWRRVIEEPRLAVVRPLPVLPWMRNSLARPHA